MVDAFKLAGDANKTDEELRLSGVAIGQILLKIVEELGLDLSRSVGQEYDGAAAFASARKSATATFRKESENAYYFHCSVHCLNLGALKAIAVPEIENAEDAIKHVIMFFISNSKLSNLLKTVIKSENEMRISKDHLISLINTRFVERLTAVQTFRSLLLYIVSALGKIMQ